MNVMVMMMMPLLDLPLWPFLVSMKTINRKRKVDLTNILLLRERPRGGNRRMLSLERDVPFDRVRRCERSERERELCCCCRPSVLSQMKIGFGENSEKIVRPQMNKNTRNENYGRRVLVVSRLVSSRLVLYPLVSYRIVSYRIASYCLVSSRRTTDALVFISMCWLFLTDVVWMASGENRGCLCSRCIDNRAI